MMSKMFKELDEELQVLYNQEENLFESKNPDLNLAFSIELL